MSIFVGYLAIGVTAGLVYALLALGMVLVYKGSRILNFAHPYFGLLTAFNVWWLTYKASFPPFRWLPFALGSRPRFLLCVVLSLGIAGLNGWLLELQVVRKLRAAPRLVLLVLTIALAQGSVGTVQLLFGRTQRQVNTFKALPVLSHFQFRLGTRFVSTADISAFVVTVSICVAAALFFTRTKFGVAVRAAAENGDAARLLGISADRVASFVWIAGSMLAGIAGILITQVTGTLDIGTLSIGFLVRGLTAALVGGLTSLPGALIGGLSVGVSEYLIRFLFPGEAGIPETILFAAVIAILLFRPGGLFGKPEETEDKVAFVPTLHDLPARLKRTAAAKGVRTLVVLPVLAVVLMSVVGGSRTNGILTLVVVYAMVGVSLTVLMGYTGQISLGHWAMVGVGAFAAANLYSRLHVPYLLALPLTVLVGMAVSLVIGLPGLRIRGLYLAVVTLAFSLACEIYLFHFNLVSGSSSGIQVHPPKFGPIDLDAPSHRPVFLFSLVLLGLAMLVASNLARSRTGRGFFAVRENEKAAATLGVRLTTYKLLAFVVSGGIAALAGAVYVTGQGFAVSSNWNTSESLVLIAMVMIGGLGSLSGAFMGAFLVIGLPKLIELDNPWIVPIGSGILLLLVIVRARGGIAGIVQAVREKLVVALEEMAQHTVPPSGAAAPGA